MAQPNYRHAKKQKEAARKARQDAKQLRRSTAPDAGNAPDAPDAPDAPGAPDARDTPDAVIGNADPLVKPIA